VTHEVFVVDDVPAEFAERVVEAFHRRARDTFSLALTGGPGAEACYRRLAADAATQIDWWKVDLWWADECCVAPEDPDSHFGMARSVLLAEVGGANAVYPLRCEEGPDAAQLRLGELGRLDVIHLTLAADGTLASLFPGSPALATDPGRLVTANTDPTGTHAHDRLTFTLAGLERAHLVLVTAEGDAVAPAVAAALATGSTEAGARLTAEAVVWLVDPAAGGSLA